MKRRELRPCDACCKPLTGTGPHRNGLDAGYRIDVQRMFVNHGAVQRVQGLELYLGSAQLADVMGPNEDLLHEPEDFRMRTLVCVDCVMLPRVELLARIGERRESAKTNDPGPAPDPIPAPEPTP